MSRSQALGLGMSERMIDRRLATGRWERMFHGVYRIAGAPTTWHQVLLAACLAAGDGAVVSGRAAAALWELPDLGREIVEISVPRARRPTLPGVIVHRPRALDRIDRTKIGGIPVTTATRALIDLAGHIGDGVLEAALDDALRRRLTTVRRLRAALTRLEPRGRRGARTIAAMVAARGREGALPESVLETRFSRLLRSAGLPPPERQYRVHFGGRMVARVDFAYPRHRVAIEVDGFRYHAGRRAFDADRARLNAIIAAGWVVIHATSTEMRKNPERLAAQVERALASAAL